MNLDYRNIQTAVNAVDKGLTKRMDLENGIKVYAVGENVIRIDIKKEVK